MALTIDRVDTWLATIKDEPGSLATKLDTLAAGGVNLELIIARRAPDKPGKGVVFVTPIKGAAQIKVAKKAAFRKTKTLQTVRVEGTNKKGIGALIAAALAEADINMRGFSAAAIGRKFIAYIALDRADDAAKARRILKKL
jgi:hypothetical protein